MAQENAAKMRRAQAVDALTRRFEASVSSLTQSLSSAATEMVVATGAADVGNLRFYQRQGFRMRSVERDVFTPAAGYPPGIVVDGVPLLDRVWLDRAVGAAPS